MFWGPLYMFSFSSDKINVLIWIYSLIKKIENEQEFKRSPLMCVIHHSPLGSRSLCLKWVLQLYLSYIVDDHDVCNEISSAESRSLSHVTSPITLVLHCERPHDPACKSCCHCSQCSLISNCPRGTEKPVIRNKQINKKIKKKNSASLKYERDVGREREATYLSQCSSSLVFHF